MGRVVDDRMNEPPGGIEALQTAHRLVLCHPKLAAPPLLPILQGECNLTDAAYGGVAARAGQDGLIRPSAIPSLGKSVIDCEVNASTASAENRCTSARACATPKPRRVTTHSPAQRSARADAQKPIPCHSVPTSKKHPHNPKGSAACPFATV
jgi:hypothetical protein